MLLAPAGFQLTRWENLARSAIPHPDTSERRSRHQNAGLSQRCRVFLRWRWECMWDEFKHRERIFHYQLLLLIFFIHCLRSGSRQSPSRSSNSSSSRRRNWGNDFFCLFCFFFLLFLSPPPPPPRTVNIFFLTMLTRGWLVHFFLRAHLESIRVRNRHQKKIKNKKTFLSDALTLFIESLVPALLCSSCRYIRCLYFGIICSISI